MDDKEFYVNVINYGPVPEEKVISEEYVDMVGWNAADTYKETGVLNETLYLYTFGQELHAIEFENLNKDQIRAAYIAIEEAYSNCRAWCIVKLTHWIVVEEGDDFPEDDELLENGREALSVRLITRDGKFWIWNLPLIDTVRNTSGRIVDVIYEIAPDIISHEIIGTDVVRSEFDPWRETGPGGYDVS